MKGKVIMVAALIAIAASVAAVEVTETHDEFRGVTTRSAMFAHPTDNGFVAWSLSAEGPHLTVIIAAASRDYHRPNRLYLLVDGVRKVYDARNRYFERRGNTIYDAAIYELTAADFREIAAAEEVRYRLSGQWNIEWELTDPERAVFLELVNRN